MLLLFKQGTLLVLNMGCATPLKKQMKGLRFFLSRAGLNSSEAIRSLGTVLRCHFTVLRLTPLMLTQNRKRGSGNGDVFRQHLS